MNRSLFGLLRAALTDHVASRGRQAKRREARPTAESLEGRQLLSWSPGNAPSHISVASETAIQNFSSNSLSGGGSLASNSSVNYTSFVAPRSGTYTFDVKSQTSGLSPYIGIYNASGNLLGASFNTSEVSRQVNLTAGQRYYLEKTNMTGSAIGSYTWSVQGPSYYSGTASDGQTSGEAHLIGNTLTVHMISATSPNPYGSTAHTVTAGLYDKYGNEVSPNTYGGQIILTGGKYVPGLPTSISDRYETYDLSNVNLTNVAYIQVRVS